MSPNVISAYERLNEVGSKFTYDVDNVFPDSQLVYEVQEDGKGAAKICLYDEMTNGEVVAIIISVKDAVGGIGFPIVVEQVTLSMPKASSPYFLTTPETDVNRDSNNKISTLFKRSAGQMSATQRNTAFVNSLRHRLRNG